METRILPKVFKSKEVEIIFLSDVHFGSEACDEVSFRKTLKYILDGKNRYVIFGGDLIEAVTPSKGGGMLSGQTCSIQDQINEMVAILRPLAKKDKILGMIDGNHEFRGMKDAMINVTQCMTLALGVSFWAEGGIFQLTVGKQKYQIAVQHGASAGINSKTELDKMTRFYPECDVFVLGHNHKIDLFDERPLVLDSEGREVPKKRLLVRSGSYMGLALYARKKMYMPSPIGSPLIVFKDDGTFREDTNTLKY